MSANTTKHAAEPLQINEIFNAARVLNGVARHTVPVHAPNFKPGVDLWLKPECLQMTGSFKLRGA